MSNNINKACIWLAVTYPENMVEGWQDKAEEIMQGLPFAYCIHDKDKSGHDGDRKTHVHWIFDFTSGSRGTTTRKHALDMVNLLSATGKICCPGVEACLNIGYAYDYLIHDTPKAIKDEKYQYPAEERITSSTFDIERYIKLSEEIKLEMAQELCDYAVEHKIKDSATFYIHLKNHFGGEYFQIYKANSAMIDRLCRGNYNRAERKRAQKELPKCCVCGSEKIYGHYETEDGNMWFCQDCQETVYNYLKESEDYEG